MRILLVQPRPRGSIGYKSTIVTEPLALEIVAGSLRDEHEVKIHDMFFDKDVAVKLREFQPAAVGISCSFTVDVYQTLEVARTVKSVNSNIFVFIGGHHATLNYTDFDDSAVDVVVLGEGETTAPDLMRVVEENGDLSRIPGLVLNTDEGQVLTEERDLLKPLDEVPVAARELMGKQRKDYFLGTRRPVIALETSRGCPYRCNFCSIWRFYKGKVREMSPERVVDELEQLPPKDTLITDDNFLANVNRADRIATLLREKKLPKRRYIIQARSDTIIKYPDLIRKWKEVGLDHVFIGFEKIDQEGMEKINKKNTVENNERALKFLQSIGVGVYASFIVDPDFTRKEFQKLLDYLKRLNIKQPQISILTPLPGTDLFREWKNNLITNNYELFDLLHTVLPTKLPLSEFYKEFAGLYRKTYFTPSGIMDTMKWVFKNSLLFHISPKHIKSLLAGVKFTGNYTAYLPYSHDERV